MISRFWLENRSNPAWHARIQLQKHSKMFTKPLPTFIHVCKKETPNLWLPPQHQVEAEKVFTGPNVQYEKAGVKISAGNWRIVLIVLLIPIDTDIVMIAYKKNLRINYQSAKWTFLHESDLQKLLVVAKKVKSKWLFLICM